MLPPTSAAVVVVVVSFDVVSNAGACDEYRKTEMNMAEANESEPKEGTVVAFVALVAVETAEGR